MIVYIAGPMTGLPEFNYPAFDAAEEELRAAGHHPINPARHGVEGDRSGWEWQDYMRRTIRDVTEADAIHMLPGWEKSRGARLEHAIAEALNLVHIGRELPIEHPTTERNAS